MTTPLADLPAFFTSSIPLWFFIAAPFGVMLLFFVLGLYGDRQGVGRSLEGGWKGYSTAQVVSTFASYGPRGRARYRHRLLVADAAFAATYAIVGLMIVVGLSMRDYSLTVALLCGGGWLFGGLCDIAEGFGLARLLDRYPAVDDGDVAFASGFTRIKLVLFLAGLAGALAAIWVVFRPLAGV